MLSIEDLRKIQAADPALFRNLVDKLADAATASAVSPYVADMFPPQRAFFDDESKRKAALCSRRAGKTFGVACWLLEGGRDCPGGLSLYVALSRNNARLILWATLIAINVRYNLGLHFGEKDNQLMVTLPNGHQIWLAGCKDSSEIEKFRGVKLRRAAIDEAASFGEYLRDLVFDVLDPCLLDYDGEMVLIGTPGVIPAGLFYEITTGDGYGQDAATKWSTHEWTVLDNPHIPHAADWLEVKRVQNRWTEDHPRYVREWLGKWVRDEGSLCYPYDPARNAYFTLPNREGRWIYALGVDVGYEDSTAFVVGAYRRGNPFIYIVEVQKHEHLIPSVVAARIQGLTEKYGIGQVVIDTGGIGKGYAEEASQRYGIYCEPAEKTKKRAFMEIVRGELLAGTIKIQPRLCEPLIVELNSLVWDEKHEAPDPTVGEDHAADAFLYLVRALLPYYRPEVLEDPLSEADIAQRQMDAARKRALKEVKARMRRNMRTGHVMQDIASGL